MKSTWLLIVGIAIGALGSGTYLSRSNHARSANADSALANPSDKSGTPQRSNRKSLWPEWNPNKGTGARSISEKDPAASPRHDPSPGASATPKTTTTHPLVTNVPRPIGGTSEPTDDELALAAERIEKRANRELERLSRLLDLSQEQQDRIFPLLARSSTAFHPTFAIQVGDAEFSEPSDLPAKSASGNDAAKAPAKSTARERSEPLLAKEADEEMHDILTPDQQEALVDAIIDEDLWWTDIVNDLEDELDESTEIAAAAAAAAAEPETSYQGNTGLGAALQQAAEESKAND